MKRGAGERGAKGGRQSAAAIVGWSGSGKLENLERTISRKISSRGEGSSVVGNTILLSSQDPVEVARRLAFLPGASWIAVGYPFRDGPGYERTIATLARRYLSKGKTFRVVAEVAGAKGGGAGGDLVLAGNSAVLAAAPGTKVSERNPGIIFRVSTSPKGGACGVEIRRGPGGTPTGSEWVACMVSGGYHSSAMAWMAALSGFSVRLVHSLSDDESLVQVGKLYSELSHRMDPTRLELLVLSGTDGRGATLGRLGAWLGRSDVPVFAGLHPERSEQVVETSKSFPEMLLPLFLMQDSDIRRVSDSLGLRDRSKRGEGILNGMATKSEYTEARFGGGEVDSNEVVDSIRRAVSR